MATPNLSHLMRKAWCIARHGASRHGGRPVQYLASALRTAWADAKAAARASAESAARVAACVAELKAKNLIAGPARPMFVRPLRTRAPFTVRC